MPIPILIVDDEADLERLIKRKFRRQIENNEFTFQFAANGLQAVEVLRDNPAIEIVLSDLNMPEMDGLTLLAHLTELPRPLKTIVVSAYGDLKNIRTAMNRGAFDFLTKPIDFADVEVTLQKTILELHKIKEAAKTQKQLFAIECELDLASRIQHALLPHISRPARAGAGLELCAEMITARMVGGDFYDLFTIDAEHVGFLIGDVAGKGVSAGLFMTATRALMRATAGQASSPGDCLARVNQLLCQENVPAMFVTMFYGVVNTVSGEVQFSVGGHSMPYRFSAGQALLPTAEGGPVLGILENATYPTSSLFLEPGEGLLLYTDGVTEAFDAQGNEYSSERLEDLLAGLSALPVQNMIGGILDSIRQFSTGAPQSDDITLLALRYLGPSQAILSGFDFLNKAASPHPAVLA